VLTYITEISIMETSVVINSFNISAIKTFNYYYKQTQWIRVYKSLSKYGKTSNRRPCPKPKGKIGKELWGGRKSGCDRIEDIKLLRVRKSKINQISVTLPITMRFDKSCWSEVTKSESSVPSTKTVRWIICWVKPNGCKRRLYKDVVLMGQDGLVRSP